MAQQKRRGRPRKVPGTAGTASLGLRVSPELKDRLDRAADRSGRTQSQEAERRLRWTFEADEAHEKLRPLIYIITLMQDEHGKRWHEDPQVAEDVFAMVEAYFRRFGKLETPMPSDEFLRVVHRQDESDKRLGEILALLTGNPKWRRK